MEQALKAIDRTTETKRASGLNRLIGKLKSDLSFSQIDEVIESGLSDYLKEIQNQSSKIHDAVYEIYIAYPIEKALTV